MANWGANRTFNKIVQRCPHFDSRKPKEIVEGGKQRTVVPYLLFSVLTCDLGLLAFPIFMKSGLRAYCEECESTFRPNV